MQYYFICNMDNELVSSYYLIKIFQVFSPCRILLLTAKVPTRIDCHFHYLEIQALESKRGNQLSITFNDKVYSFLTGDDSTCSQEVDSMVSALATAIRNIYPTVPLQYIIRKVQKKILICFLYIYEKLFFSYSIIDITLFIFLIL